MKIQQFIFIILYIILAIPGQGIAQEMQESAEISLEAYSDAFQEHFFGALKEKAVENYEKAINLLLECKKLEPENAVVDYELGKNHFALRQYPQAETYFKKATTKAPENIWYSEALFNTYKTQQNITEVVKIGKQLAQKHHKYKERMVLFYAQHKKYKEALQLLDELDQTLGSSTQRKYQRIRYQALMNVKSHNQTANAEERETSKDNPLTAINNKIATYQNASDYKGLLKFIDEVLEMYPSQATLYYVKGKTLNSLKKYAEAIVSLKMALDFIVEDTALENNIYKALVLAHQATGNTKKAQEYSRKIKSKA
ncbi:MAG: hypothetical protein AAF934_12040 [Bacteroidota bacterium]